MSENKQNILISDNQLWELINNEFIILTNPDGSIIRIDVKKRIDEETFNENKWLYRLKRFFICNFLGHDEVGVYSWISYCQRCSYS